MTVEIVLTKEDCENSFIDFYDIVARKAGYNVDDSTEYDCRKIRVSKNVLDTIIEQYKRRNIDDFTIAALTMCYGPKASIDSEEDEYIVRIEPDFVL